MNKAIRLIRLSGNDSGERHSIVQVVFGAGHEAYKEASVKVPEVTMFQWIVVHSY